jgi:hypothetical protein
MRISATSSEGKHPEWIRVSNPKPIEQLFLLYLGRKSLNFRPKQNSISHIFNEVKINVITEQKPKITGG